MAAMEHDPNDPYQQDTQREEHQKLLVLAQQQATEDAKWIMNDPRGRRFIWNYLAHAGVFQTTFDQSHASMAFTEGRRSEGLRLFALVTAAGPDLYATMMKENTK